LAGDTSFRQELPYEMCRSAHDHACRRRYVIGLFVPDERSYARVLIVNDDVVLATSAAALLAEIGEEARIAADGQQGLDMLADSRADLVLLDLIMPRLDGWAFLERLASIPADQRPVVLVWSVAEAPDLDRARRLGAAECLSRARTSPDELLDAIQRLLECRIHAPDFALQSHLVSKGSAFGASES
jgi:CheY-like chemotaxis protein